MVRRRSGTLCGKGGSEGGKGGSECGKGGLVRMVVGVL
jgi:hypothetical protein